ncbi:hypothetical protein JB92DRAFT_2831698 [Gautieria morchelliformis]|nr:hypothetical protein JB92DRAFT_2831698 [Gautieria morchelliformis]
MGLKLRKTRVISVDYSSVPSLTNALQGADVVFSALRDDSWAAYSNERAAKDAKVKLYTLHKPKADVQDLIKELRPPYTLSCGRKCCSKSLYHGHRHAVFLSFTISLPHCHHLNLRTRCTFEIEGDRKSFRDLAALWEAKHGRRAEVAGRSREEVQKFLDEWHPSPLLRFLMGESRGDAGYARWVGSRIYDLSTAYTDIFFVWVSS